jgi:hypothetical protein
LNKTWNTNVSLFEGETKSLDPRQDSEVDGRWKVGYQWDNVIEKTEECEKKKENYICN